MRQFLSVLTFLINLVFPQECAGCGKEGEILCLTCINTSQRATRPEHSFINAIFDYSDTLIKRSIWHFKYRNARSYAKIFAPHMYEEIIGLIGNELFISDNENILIVPIPLHKKRLRERGYNQSEILAREIIKLDTSGLLRYAPQLLIRAKKTSTQAKAGGKAERFKNIQGAFHSPNAELARGCTAVIIDDVTTTGATFVDAKRALKSAGARSVIACAIAH